MPCPPLPVRPKKHWFEGNLPHDPGTQIGEGEERVEAGLPLDSVPQWTSPVLHQVGPWGHRVRKAPVPTGHSGRWAGPRQTQPDSG